MSMSSEFVVDDYVASYVGSTVHSDMLKDRPRMLAYSRAIESAVKTIQLSKSHSRVSVIDVGAGTGILSLISARAGADRVLAVEQSPVARVAEQIVQHNGFGDVIEVVESAVEDDSKMYVHVGHPEKFDILVSEWMGFYLVHEGMLPSVIAARDRYLKLETGIILPRSARILACPVSCEKLYRERVQFWAEPEETMGFDMSAMLGMSMLEMFSTPHVMEVDRNQLLADPLAIAQFDLMTVTAADLAHIVSDFRFTVNVASVQQQSDAGKEPAHADDSVSSSRASRQLHGIALWFDCGFGVSDQPEAAAKPVCHERDEVTLDTSPLVPMTHWKQTVVLVQDVRDVEAGDSVVGRIELRRAENNPRSYDVCLFDYCSLPAVKQEFPLPTSTRSVT